MKKLLFILFAFTSTAAFANDPHWFDRAQASYTANHLAQVYTRFVYELDYQLGRYHPLARAAGAGEYEMRGLAMGLDRRDPFGQLYNAERLYYRSTWERVKTEWLYANIRFHRLVQMYNEIFFLSDKLHYVFNRPTPPPPVWTGSCRVVLETLWGDDLSDYWGSAQGRTQGEALEGARQHGIQMCERARGSSSLKKCTVDQGKCLATRQ